MRVEHVSEARVDVVWPYGVSHARARRIRNIARIVYPHFKATLKQKSATAKKDKTKKAKESSEEADGDSGSNSEAKEDSEEDDGDSGSSTEEGIIGEGIIG